MAPEVPQGKIVLGDLPAHSKKKCRSCGRWLPRTEKSFERAPGVRGWKPFCRACQAKVNKRLGKNPL